MPVKTKNYQSKASGCCVGGKSQFIPHDTNTYNVPDGTESGKFDQGKTNPEQTMAIWPL